MSAGPATARRLPSIRTRLVQALLAGSLAWGVAVTLAVAAVVRHEVDELMDLTLRESAEILHGVLSLNPAGLPRGPVAGAALKAGSRGDHLAWQLVDRQGVVLLHSHTAPAHPLRSGAALGFSDATGQWRIYGQPFPLDGDPAAMLFVAQNDSERAEARLEAVVLTVLAALLVGLAFALALRWRLRRELQPLADLSDAVRAFDPLRPQAPLPQAQRTELAPLQHAIDDLAARLARRVASERAFSAHAAHALRTPLAGLDVQLAVALRDSDAALRPRLQRSREAVARLRRVVHALLTLFRSGTEPLRERLALPDLAAHLPVEGLELDLPPGSALTADPDLLTAALINLLDNARRHGASRVRLAASVEGSGPTARQVLDVVDDGAGIPAAPRAALQAALDAQDPSRLPGLGLMLADLVARAHGGRLQLGESARGCTVRLDLGPAA